MKTGSPTQHEKQNGNPPAQTQELDFAFCDTCSKTNAIKFWVQSICCCKFARSVVLVARCQGQVFLAQGQVPSPIVIGRFPLPIGHCHCHFAL